MIYLQCPLLSLIALIKADMALRLLDLLKHNKRIIISVRIWHFNISTDFNIAYLSFQTVDSGTTARGVENWDHLLGSKSNVGQSPANLSYSASTDYLLYIQTVTLKACKNV